MANPKVSEIYFTKDIDIKNTAIVDKKVLIDGQGRTMTFANSSPSERVKYAIHVYRAKDVVIKDLTIDKGEAGVLVNGSVVSLDNVTTKNAGLGGIEVSQGEDVTETPKLTVDIKSKHINENEEQMPFVWIDGKTTNDNWVVGSIERLFSYIDTEKDQLHYYMEAYVPPIVEDVFTDGEIVSIDTKDGSLLKPSGEIETTVSFGEKNGEPITLEDVYTLKVHLKQSNLFLASNTLQIDKLTEEEKKVTSIMSPFTIGQETEDMEGQWILGVYKLKGEDPTSEDLPNIVNVEMIFKDGKEFNFSKKIEPALTMPNPY